jgi:hypothetical protein
MRKLAIIPSALCFVWTGVSLAGSFVATPAKFQAPSLDLSTALEVGRAQFAWLGYTECVLMGLLIISVILNRKDIIWGWVALPIAMFLIQRLGVMPALDMAAVQQIAGNPPQSEGLHIIYIVLEVAKFLSLIAAGFLMLNFSKKRAANSR